MEKTGTLPNKKIKDIAGQRFGRLVVLDFSHIALRPVQRNGETKTGAAMWRCRCDCGKERVILGSALRSGVSRSCGCLVSERMRKAPGVASENAIFSRYLVSAEVRCLPFLLTREEFFLIGRQNCWYCNTPSREIYARKGSNGSVLFTGIDRKNPDLGYTLDNSAPCCDGCNWLKNDLSLDEFKEKIRLIYLNWASK